MCPLSISLSFNFRFGPFPHHHLSAWHPYNDIPGLCPIQWKRIINSWIINNAGYSLVRSQCHCDDVARLLVDPGWWLGLRRPCLNQNVLLCRSMSLPLLECDGWPGEGQLAPHAPASLMRIFLTSNVKQNRIREFFNPMDNLRFDQECQWQQHCYHHHHHHHSSSPGSDVGNVLMNLGRWKD